jgi:hypothetical protein
VKSLPESSRRVSSQWMNWRRIRAHAIILAMCLWGVCAADYATPGLFDRAGNVKFQDFIQFPIVAHMIAHGDSAQLYNDEALARGIQAIVGADSRVSLRYFYGPQVALAFVPLIGLSFLAQAAIWVALSLLMYFACIYLLWKTCPALAPYSGLVAICALAYPPLFHFFVRGQISVLLLVFFTLAYLALCRQYDWLSGIALGFLVLKPQFLVAVALVVMLARAWKLLAGLILSASAQMAFTYVYFGQAVMRSYFTMLLHSASQPRSTELSLSPIQMHSLYAFWELLVPSPRGVWILYGFSSVVVIAAAATIWRSDSPRAVRFSALLVASVLVNPHMYIYDLLVLIPALLLLADWSLSSRAHPSTPALFSLLYLSFVLPLLGPLARWTHLQLSVPTFAALLWILWSLSRKTGETRIDQLASIESHVV